jgi:uncharacterized protein (TIGR03435 family)
MATRSALIAAFAFGFTVSALGQTGAPERKPSFEVASVKPNKETGGSFSLSGNRQTFIGTTAGSLIAYAFNLRDAEVIGGPPWVHADRLDVIAQAERKPTPEEFRLMMQSLLEERFALKAHRETREAPVYRLVLAKRDGTLGPQLLKSDSECGAPPPTSVPWAIHACRGRMGPADMTMGAELFSGLISTLESLVDRRIIDETGLSGRFDARLEWSRGEKDLTRPSIYTAIQEQLGLKLEPARGPVNVLVVDSISRPTPD